LPFTISIYSPSAHVFAVPAIAIKIFDFFLQHNPKAPKIEWVAKQQGMLFFVAISAIEESNNFCTL